MKHGNIKDITGRRFERLLVLEFAYTEKRKAYWKCFCDLEFGGCGAEKIICGNSLRSGSTKSCGCLNIEKIIERNKRGPSEETKKKMSENRYDFSGENNPNYGKSGRDTSGYKHGLSHTSAYKNMKSRERGAMKLNQTPALTEEEKHRIEILYQWAQIFSGDWHIDHIIPLDKGGLHHPDNLQLIPAKQNRSKGTKDPKEFYGRFYEFLCEGKQ